MKKPIHLEATAPPRARYELRITVEANWDAETPLTSAEEKTENANQVAAAVRHHLQKAKIPVISIHPAAHVRKKIVQTLRGDSLPPVTREKTDDTRNPFEVDIDRETSGIQLFVESDGRWIELAYLIMPEIPEEPEA